MLWINELGFDSDAKLKDWNKFKSSAFTLRIKEALWKKAVECQFKMIKKSV